jgi:putative DNA primase/helicase
MTHFQQQGRTLLSNGYLIVPIKPGAKRPALSEWQTSRLGAADLADYPGCGVGVLCGQGANPIAAIDVDTSNQVLAARFVEWCQENLGATCERVGNAPKILLTYRAEKPGWGKATGAWFEDATVVLDAKGEPVRHRLEVLNKGQQFVAYHIHPDTGLPYQWVDLFGGIEHFPARELPIVTEDQIAEAQAVFERMAGEVGLIKVSNGREMYVSSDDDNFLENFSPPTGVDLGRIKKALVHIDFEDYDSWVRVGMALHHEFEGDVAALDVWDEWSAQGSSYQGRDDLEKRWKSFGGNGKCTTVRWILKIANPKEREVARVERRAALTELLDVIAACEDSIDLLDGPVILKARSLIAQTPALKGEVGAALKRRYRELAGCALPVAELSKALRGPSVPTVKTKRPMTEFGNTERMLDKYGEGLMYVPELSSWFCWTGIYWRKSSDVEIEHYAKETVRALNAEGAEEADLAEFFKFCAISQQAKMVRNMVQLAKSDPLVYVPARELDKESRYLGATNGVIDLKTGKLLPPDKNLRITRTTGCDYLPGAGAGLWRQTILDVLSGDEELALYLQTLMGYAAMGKPDQDVMLIPHGGGSNGKSTVFNTLRKTFGGYAKSAEASSFVSDAKNGGGAGGARADLVALRGARFVYVNEPDENGELREGSVKAMTGGDTITARGLYATDMIEIEPSWLAVMPTNHKPIVKGDDDGIWRRLLLMPFLRNFEKDPTVEKDPERETKLLAEMPGVLNWIVEGALRYQREGLKKNGRVRAASDSYRNDMDLLAEWLDECCEISPEASAQSNALWKSWEEFAKNRGLLKYISSANLLGRRLENRFPARKSKNGARFRTGLMLKNAGELF